MEAIESRDLLDQEFCWTVVGIGAVPIENAKFDAYFYSNSGSQDLVAKFTEFSIEDAYKGLFRMQASTDFLNTCFKDGDTVTLIVTGQLPNTGRTPICKRKVIKCH